MNGVRSLFEGAHNTRDLGGHRTEDGREVRHGMIYRSDALIELTEADMQVLEKLGLRTIVDLRTAGEIENLGANAAASGTQVLHWSLIDESGDTLAATLTMAFQENSREDIERLLGDGAAERMLRDSAIRFSQQAIPLGYFGQMLRLLAADGAPLLFNCRAGKDRTGFMSAVILRTLGVSEADVIADYIASNDYLASRTAGMHTMLAGSGIDMELIRPLMEQRAETMEVFFSTVNSRYGSWSGFLTEALRIEDETIAALHETYLD